MKNERLIAWLENEIAIARRLAQHYENEPDSLYNYAFFEGREVMAQMVIDNLRNVPKAGDRVEDGGQMGTLVRCYECSGDGLLHKPDHMPEPIAPEDTEETSD